VSKVTSLDAHKNRLSKQLKSELDATAMNVQEVQAKISEVSALVLDTVLDDLRSRKVSGYNASCILSNVLTSFTRLLRLRLEIIDRLNGITPKEQALEEKDSESLEQKESRRMAEAMLARLLKNKYDNPALKESTTTSFLPISKVATE
jgi:hypothetical protein